MPKHNRVLLLAALLLVADQALAEPFKFKGLTLGQSLAAAASESGTTCSGDGADQFGVLCVRHIGAPPVGYRLIAGELLRDLWLNGYDGVLGMIRAQFLSGSFSAVREGLRQQGVRLECKSSVIQSPIGTRFNQEECVAEADDHTIELKKYADVYTDGLLRVTSKAYEAERTARREAAKPKGL